jgi:hypothetical protein
VGEERPTRNLNRFYQLRLHSQGEAPELEVGKPMIHIPI